MSTCVHNCKVWLTSNFEHRQRLIRVQGRAIHNYLVHSKGVTKHEVSSQLLSSAKSASNFWVTLCVC